MRRSAIYTTLNEGQVSIHAPWEGCDRTLKVTFSTIIAVSIHAPWEGCDEKGVRLDNMLKVSIHAPWEGCDADYTDITND